MTGGWRRLRSRHRRLALAGLALLALPGASAALGDGASLESLRQADLRLATIGHRLAVANAALCADQSPATGMVLHAIDQYATGEQAEARASFGFETAVAVEAVVPGSVAERAGVRADDSIVSINGQAVPAAAGGGTVATRDAAWTLLQSQPPDRPIGLIVRRAQVEQRVQIAPSRGCRTLFELRVDTSLNATADGRLVQISSGFLDRLADPQLAVVVAHELSHNILRHHDRLEAARVSRGLFRELGRNGRLFRTTEDEADRLGMHLLRNAGWDPTLAVAFWRGPGAKIAGGIFYSRTHASPGNRATTIAAEIATLPPGAPIPYLPPILATRDQPLR